MLVDVEGPGGRRFRVVRSPLTRPYDGELSYRISELGDSTAEVLAELDLSAVELDAILRH